MQIYNITMNGQILLGCCFLLFSIIITPFVCAYEIILSPISIPCYFIRKRNHSKWLTAWKNNLSEIEIDAVETHIDGPINIYEFRKYATSNFEARLGIIIGGAPKLIPTIFLRPINIPCSYDPDEHEFTESLNYMLKCLNISDLEKNINSREGRILRALILDTNECAICKDDEDPLEFDNSKMLKCAHVFHEYCIERALEIKRECPICRSDL